MLKIKLLFNMITSLLIAIFSIFIMFDEDIIIEKFALHGTGSIGYLNEVVGFISFVIWLNQFKKDFIKWKKMTIIKE